MQSSQHFLDAIAVATRFAGEIHFLARGDLFTETTKKLFRRLNLIPIYRISEGREHVKNNDQSFDACIKVLKSGGSILIFAEGLCENEWKLRPLKKGCARIAYKAWHQENINAAVVPVGITYHSFKRLPKSIWINTSDVIRKNDIYAGYNAGFYQQFNIPP